MGKFKKIMEVSSNIGGYGADEGEPWFERGGYEQVEFPKADYIYGKGEDEDYAVIKTAYINQINKDFEAHFDSWENWIADEDFEPQNTQINDSKYRKVMNNLLLERVDYFDTAQQLVKQYGLKSRVKFTSGSQMAEYVPETDTITLRRSYPSLKEFLLTVLHEIKHALDAKRLGVRKFIKKYTQAGTMAQYRGLDPHDDNRWEEKAEKFARRELFRWM